VSYLCNIAGGTVVATLWSFCCVRNHDLLRCNTVSDSSSLQTIMWDVTMEKDRRDVPEAVTKIQDFQNDEGLLFGSCSGPFVSPCSSVYHPLNPAFRCGASKVDGGHAKLHWAEYVLLSLWRWYGSVAPSSFLPFPFFLSVSARHSKHPHHGHQQAT
jgi:hypothetical protein